MTWLWGRRRRRPESAAALEAALVAAREARNWSWAQLLATGPKRPSTAWLVARRGEIAAHDVRIAAIVVALSRRRLAESRRTSRPAATIDTL